MPTIKLLSLETSTDRGSFCLWLGDVREGHCQFLKTESVICPAGQPHAETLLPLLRDALAAFGWQLQDLDAIVYDAGPGMFTGLRVAAALAQGLAVACDKPLVAVSSLEALAESAYQLTGATRVLTLLDARMNQVYAAAWYRTDQGWKTEIDACLVNPDALSSLMLPKDYQTVAGTALNEYPEVVAWCDEYRLNDSQVRHPTAESLATAGAMHYAGGNRQDPADAVPVYVRDRVALTTAERLAGQTL